MNPQTRNPAGAPKLDRAARSRVAPETQKGGSEQFQRFEDLTRKVVQVPKTELDDKRNEP